jgi:cytochrome c-type biogenesis protein CcsB
MADATLARLSDNLFWIALVVYAVAMVAFLAGFAYRARRVSSGAFALVVAGAAAHLTSIIARGFAAHRVPWGNMYEYSTVLGFLLVVGYLVIDRRLGLRALGGFAMGAAVLAMGAARLLYAPAGPLVPALNSYWLRIHVIAAILGSTLFGLSFIFTALYLIKDRAERRSSVRFAGSTVGAAFAGTGVDAPADQSLPPDLIDREEDEPPRPGLLGGVLARLPGSQTFDQLAFRTVTFAFPVWTFAVIAGAIWAHEAWGRYWGWDPKETWAFITWVIYAGYLHARATAGWRGRKAAGIACVGFVSLLFTYYAVNLWISGLHSYAK